MVSVEHSRSKGCMMVYGTNDQSNGDIGQYNGVLFYDGDECMVELSITLLRDGRFVHCCFPNIGAVTRLTKLHSYFGIVFCLIGK